MPTSPSPAESVAEKNDDGRPHAASAAEAERVKSESDFRIEVIKYLLARQNASQSYNSEMSKWILASLILVNGGPFVLISKDNTDYVHKLMSASGYFVAGLACAILCGFLAWLNTGMREADLGNIAEELIKGNEVSASMQVTTRYRPVISVSYIVSILAGFASLAAFLVGTIVLYCSYQRQPSLKANSGYEIGPAKKLYVTRPV